MNKHSDPEEGKMRDWRGRSSVGGPNTAQTCEHGEMIREGCDVRNPHLSQLPALADEHMVEAPRRRLRGEGDRGRALHPLEDFSKIRPGPEEVQRRVSAEVDPRFIDESMPTLRLRREGVEIPQHDLSRRRALAEEVSEDTRLTHAIDRIKRLEVNVEERHPLSMNLDLHALNDAVQIEEVVPEWMGRRLRE